MDIIVVIINVKINTQVKSTMFVFLKSPNLKKLLNSHERDFVAFLEVHYGNSFNSTVAIY